MSSLLLEHSGRIAVVTVNRPEKLNALDNSVVAELRTMMEELAENGEVGAIILTGAGEKAFIAGADIGMLAKQGVLDGAANSRQGQELTMTMERSSVPILAAINGYALGGGLELALACDLRFAAKGAKMGLPEVSLGLIPGYGGTQRLPRLVGKSRALQMILTGDPVDADEAERIGLINGVFEPEQLLPGVAKVAERILSRGPMAVALAKQAVHRGAHLSLTDGLRLEADLFGMTSSTDEMKEGTQAFLEKRKPNW